MKARIHKILKNTKVEGPNTRYCIWFQGCSRHCKGCWAKATWDYDGGFELDVEELLADILSTKGIEGVTFLGGEPFEQPDVIKYLAQHLRKNNLGVLCFTGNKFEEIEQKDVLEYIDLLIDGEFIEEEKDFSRPWVGSKNQRYHFLSERYSPKILSEYKNKVEINISEDGMIFINGMGDFEKLSQNLEMLTNH